MSSKPIYTRTSYKSNLKKYWRQFNPLYEIPNGYHVHHIIPKCVCKHKGWSEKRMNHPRNLIALHPDDHETIHRLRGDVRVNGNFINVIGRSGWNHSDETKEKMSLSAKGLVKSEEHRKNIGLAQIGANNNRYTGDYITPWGVFESTYQAAESCPVDISYQTIRTWCKQNSKIVRRITIAMSKYLNEEHLGKTFEELGFSFQEKQ